MASFKFNFNCSDNGLVNATNDDEKYMYMPEALVEAEEIKPDKQLKDFESFVTHARMFTSGQVEIGHVESSDVIDKLRDKFTNSVNQADTEHSDLIPGKYEGGLKIWECTSDLITYLTQNEDSISLKNKNVLDLGCGAGILGIYALLNGSAVTFQDYNKEIIEYVTIPNVLLNLEEDEQGSLINRCKFYSGDWLTFSKKLPTAETYDLILTSETIYNDANYDKIISLLTTRLKINGSAYVAAKTHYFGVGGGTRIFETALKLNGSLESDVCWKSLGGIQREILKIKHKNL